MLDSSGGGSRWGPAGGVPHERRMRFRSKARARDASLEGEGRREMQV